LADAHLQIPAARLERNTVEQCPTVRTVMTRRSPSNAGLRLSTGRYCFAAERLHVVARTTHSLRNLEMSLTYFAEMNGGIEELWVTDGTAAGTRKVKAFGPLSTDNIVEIGTHAFMSVNDGIHGLELWMTDGTTAGTVIADILPGPTGSFPAEMTAANRTLFFQADDGIHGNELWKSDGTVAGTKMVADIQPGAGGSTPNGFVNVNGTVFFAANDGTHGAELWKSDGTAAGTVMVKDIHPGGLGSGPNDLVNVNGEVFFSATDGTKGFELWKSDGTAAGTVMVKDINSGAGDSFPNGLANVNGELFFAATDGMHGSELWKSDGTQAGTVMVKDIWSGATGSTPANLTNVNGELFFTASDPTDGLELWKSDGTTTGTVLVKDILVGAGSSNPANFVNVNGELFFTATDGLKGVELWKSDGTQTGTVMVKDINSGAGDSNPQNLTNVNGVLEFEAFDGTKWDLFKSDGTAPGTTVLATNLDPIVPFGFTPPTAAINDMNGDGMSDMVWRNTNGSLGVWLMNGGIISGGTLTSGGAAVAPDASWSIAGISDFNGDGNADILWRDTSGEVAAWLMNGTSITSGADLTSGGVAVRPDASWSVAGTGDFNGDGNADILWRDTSGEVAIWTMNGNAITSGADVTSGGSVVRPDASWSVAGIGDFNGDGNRDILWRSTAGEVSLWTMNGSTITGGGDLTSGGASVRPDASWSIAGIGDFNGDGNSDVLWRNSSGALNLWLMNGTTITSGGPVTSGGVAVSPDASWHVVEIGDFNGDGNSDILWRNNSGALSEWLMNGNTITQSVTPTFNGSTVSPDASWNTQAKPTNFG
jgi:ELWxxDGT repeat protein